MFSRFGRSLKLLLEDTVTLSARLLARSVVRNGGTSYDPAANCPMLVLLLDFGTRFTWQELVFLAINPSWYCFLNASTGLLA